MEAWKSVLQRASHFQHHRLGRAELSVREHMSDILRKLKQQPLMEFFELFDLQQDGIPKLVVNFLAILELAKEGLLYITQTSVNSPIYVQMQSGQRLAMEVTG